MLRDEIARYTELSGNDGEHTPIGIIGAFLDGYETGLKDISKREWISVSERLPEERQSVLVWCSQYRNIYCAYLEKEQWWIFGAFIQIVPSEVVAWQPLPEPYKGESEEE